VRTKVGNTAVDDLHVVEIILHLRLESLGIEAGIEDDNIVSVDDQGTVDMLDLTQLFQCETAVVGEIAPLFIDHDTRDAVLGEEIPNDLLRAVRRAGIDDQNVVD